MPPEIKIWLHRQPSKRDWKKLANRGEDIPSVALERDKSLAKWAKRNCQYLPHMDGWALPNAPTT